MSKNRDLIYCCTECPSSIEILSINDNNNFIEFKCLNQNNNHKSQMRKTISIEAYLEKIEKYTQKKINKSIKKGINIFVIALIAIIIYVRNV